MKARLVTRGKTSRGSDAEVRDGSDFLAVGVENWVSHELGERIDHACS